MMNLRARQRPAPQGLNTPENRIFAHSPLLTETRMGRVSRKAIAGAATLITMSADHQSVLAQSVSATANGASGWEKIINFITMPIGPIHEAIARGQRIWPTLAAAGAYFVGNTLARNAMQAWTRRARQTAQAPTETGTDETNQAEKERVEPGTQASSAGYGTALRKKVVRWMSGGARVSARHLSGAGLAATAYYAAEPVWKIATAVAQMVCEAWSKL